MQYDPMIEKRIDEIIAMIDSLPYKEMVKAKCDQLRPANKWETAPININGLVIPGFRYADGPKGVGDNTTPPANGYARGKATCFPARINQASTWNPELVEKISRAMSMEFVASGVNVILNCCVDLVRDPRSGRVQETLGEDPYLAGRMAVATVVGTQSTGAIANVKHFCLNYMECGRGTWADYLKWHVNNYLIDQRTLIEHYGLPLLMAIREGNAMSVMAAYNRINGEKCTENHNILTEILREQWGFKYWVVSDWTANVSGYKAFNAGLDCDEAVVVPSMYRLRLESDVRKGKIGKEALDRSVRRVLRTKLESRVMDYYHRYEPVPVEAVNSSENQTLAKLSALESIVLLMNRNNILPILKDKYHKIAVIGPNADKINALCGDVDPGSSYVDAAYQVSVLAGMKNKIGGERIRYKKGCMTKRSPFDRFRMKDAIKAARLCDLILFVGGINYEIEGETRDRYQWTIDLPGSQAQLINRLKDETGKPVIIVLAGGGAMRVGGFIDKVDALIMAGYPGMEGGNAIADIIFGDYNPDGKLAMTIPECDADMPDLGSPGNVEFDFSRDITDGIGYRYYDRKNIQPQYAFGFGLSYTSFRISNLKLDDQTCSFPIEVKSGSMPVKVSVDVTNTGTRSGKEVIQLYLSHDPSCSVIMPVKQLKGFRKISLNPGETCTVHFKLTEAELAYYDISTKSFKGENGVYTVRVGNSSDFLPLIGSFRLTD